MKTGYKSKLPPTVPFSGLTELQANYDQKQKKNHEIPLLLPLSFVSFLLPIASYQIESNSCCTVQCSQSVKAN